MKTLVAVHVVIAFLLVALSYRLYRAMIKGRDNFYAINSTQDDRMHLIDHLIGGLLAFTGSSFAATFTIIEIGGFLIGIGYDLEVPTSASFILLLAGMIYLAWHFEKEETPDHPFYHWIGRAK